MQRIKRAVLPVFFGALCVLSALAAFGRMSGAPQEPDQNLLGGTGALRTCLQVMYDDSCIYFVGNGTYGAELYMKNTQTGTVRGVCTRVLCRHDTPDCTVYPLYDSGHLTYFAADSDLYYTAAEDDRLNLYRWDVQTGRRKQVYSFDRVIRATGRNGSFAEVNASVNLLRRISPDMLILQYVGTAMLFDNDFNLLRQFPCGTGIVFACTEQEIFWMLGDDFCCYHIAEDSIAQNILADVLPDFFPESISFGCYGRALYFGYNGSIMAYHADTGAVGKVTDADSQAGCAVFGSALFYMKDGALHRYELISADDAVIAGADRLPLGETDTDDLFSDGRDLRLIARKDADT